MESLGILIINHFEKKMVQFGPIRKFFDLKYFELGT